MPAVQPPSTTHAGLLRQFALLAADTAVGDEEVRRAVGALNAAQRRRREADYHTTDRPPPDLARRAAREAREFIAICAARFGLPAPPPP